MNYDDLLNDEQRDGLFGVYMGVVADLKDPEDLARVKVKFPWRDADDKSEWARLATPMAGKKMGQYFLPEKGDEVLVAFNEGDIHEPFIIGGLWNGDMKPPQPNKKKNPIRQIKSRADHKLTFDDTDNVGNVTIETGKGQKVVIDDKNEKIVVEDKNDNKMTMDSSGVTIDSPKKIKLSAKNVEISADQNVDVSGQKITETAKSQMKHESKGQMNVKSGMMMNVKSGAMLKIKGSMVMIN